MQFLYLLLQLLYLLVPLLQQLLVPLSPNALRRHSALSFFQSLSEILVDFADVDDEVLEEVSLLHHFLVLRLRHRLRLLLLLFHIGGLIQGDLVDSDQAVVSIFFLAFNSLFITVAASLFLLVSDVEGAPTALRGTSARDFPYPE